MNDFHLRIIPVAPKPLDQRAREAEGLRVKHAHAIAGTHRLVAILSAAVALAILCVALA